MSARTRKGPRARKRGGSKVWFTLPALHQNYPVFREKEPTIDGGNVVAGCYVPCLTHPKTRRRIVVDAERTVEQQRAALWHEAFHVIFHEGGHDSLFTDEALCEMLAFAIMRIRKEVPWL